MHTASVYYWTYSEMCLFKHFTYSHRPSPQHHLQPTLIMSTSIYSFYTQLFPPDPLYTDKDVPNLQGKVYMVTGSNTGIGYEIVKVLYAKGARVYMACRTESKAKAAIAALGSIRTSTPGEVRYLHLNLSDLSSVKATVEEFSRQESKLDVLWNNAGIGGQAGTITTQGHDDYMQIMCLGPFLLTQLLLPNLRRAAASSPRGSVRVTFTGSRLMEADAPPNGILMSELDAPGRPFSRLYSQAKAGNFFLGALMARQLQSDGIIALTINPGNLRTQIYDTIPSWVLSMIGFLLYDVKYGCYPNLWAGLSTDITMEDTGRYVIPWGRWSIKVRADILNALKSEKEGGSGVAQQFWDWCEKETKEWR